MDENKDPTEFQDRINENGQEFDQGSSQILDTDECEDIENISDKMESNAVASSKENKSTINTDSSTGAEDDYTDVESDGQAESSPVEELMSDGVSTELYSEAESSLSHDPEFIANQNQELKNRDLQKWIQSVERSSVIGENYEKTMDGNQQRNIHTQESYHQKQVTMETQTDWEWVVSAVAKKEEEEVEEDDVSSDDERPSSSNSTKSSDLISCSTPPLMPGNASPSCLPDVGLPKILQSSRESERENVSLETNKVSHVPTKSLMGLCDFCQNPTKPLPTLEQESTLCPEDLFCCEEYQKFLEMVLQNDIEETRLKSEYEQSEGTTLSTEQGESRSCLPKRKILNKKEFKKSSRESERENVSLETNKVSHVPTKSLMGLCDFCQNPTKPLPTLEQESTLCPEDLFCCEEYQKFLEMVLQNDIEETRLKSEYEQSEGTTLSTEQGESRSCLPKRKILNKKEFKNKMKAAREMKMKQKQQETFLQQQQQQQQKAQIPPQGYHTTRQMNTINYQLSSRRCLEEGWTVRTPYLEQLDFDADIFEVEPGKRISFWRGDENISEGPLEKFYDNGNKFFTIFADGTGNIFGRLAVLITATLPCHFTYVIYCETKKRVAAIFEHTGYGTCYHDNGNIRLYIDPSGGVEADMGGAIKRKWQWYQPGSHVHAPPLQPIHLAVNKYIGIKLVSQRNIQLNFMAKRRSCKINMGVNVKPVNVQKSPLVTDESHFYLEDKKTNIECILSKVRNLIQYANSPKLEQILPPIYLTNKTSKLQQQAKQVPHTKKRPKVIVKSEISLSL